VNESRLEKRLRFQLDCSRIVWKKPTKKQFARVDHDMGGFKITLPTEHHQGKTYDDEYLLQTLFHELTHVSMPGELWAWGDFTEDILTRVVEPRLMAHLANEPKVQAWWLKALKKLKEAKGGGAS
jgi:hypothetical protein